jgi:hypothetical protein
MASNRDRQFQSEQSMAVSNAPRAKPSGARRTALGRLFVLDLSGKHIFTIGIGRQSPRISRRQPV